MRAPLRLLLAILTVMLTTTFVLSLSPYPQPMSYLYGALLGSGMFLLLLWCDALFRRLDLRFFNTVALGLFCGYLMSFPLLLVLNSAVQLIGVQGAWIDLSRLFLLLFAVYVGVQTTLRANGEIALSIPFVRLSPSSCSIRQLILDQSALEDARIIDLALTGILDRRLVLPRFVLKNLSDGSAGLEVAKKLEQIPSLGLRYFDGEIESESDCEQKVLGLARMQDADVLSAALDRTLSIDGVHVINMHTLSNAMKPLRQHGEYLKIKIQRIGKEEQQGVGYLEDGTMVVVNGGGEFVGETISSHVLSVKHTSSGRMIFCNALEREYEEQPV